MRSLITVIGEYRLFRDRSPDGIPRYIAEHTRTGSIHIWSKPYFKLSQIEETLDRWSC